MFWFTFDGQPSALRRQPPRAGFVFVSKSSRSFGEFTKSVVASKEGAFLVGRLQADRELTVP